jgi:hypothetical protein
VTVAEVPFADDGAALATPAPVARAPRAITADTLTRFTSFFFVVRYMEDLSDNTSTYFEA